MVTSLQQSATKSEQVNVPLTECYRYYLRSTCEDEVNTLQKIDSSARDTYIHLEIVTIQRMLLRMVLCSTVPE